MLKETLNMDNPYTMTSKIERIALNNIIPKLFSGGKISFYTTPDEGTDIYDGYVMKMDDNFSIIDRYIIECKVRDTFYPTLLLEKKKYESLRQKALESDAKIIYICVTPDGAFCFNLNKLITPDTKWIKEQHWKSTQNKCAGKINKSVFYINIDQAKKISYTTKDCQNEYNKKVETIKVISEIKEKVDWLDEFIVKKNK